MMFKDKAFYEIKANENNDFKIGDKLIHIGTGIVGLFLKSYYPTASARTLQIKCSNGKIFYAPYNQFRKY